MRYFQTVVYVVLIAFCAQLRIAWAVSDQSTQHLGYFADLFSENEEERFTTYRKFYNEVDLRIQELISIVNTKGIEKDHPDALEYAISLLGKYRSTDAIKPIAQHLTFQTNGYRITALRAVPDQERYIAVNMLIKIGNTEVTAPVLLRKIEESPNAFERELAAYVLGKVLGREQAKQAFVDAESKAFDNKAKEHYRKAAEFISNVSFVALPPKLTPAPIESINRH